MAQGTTFQQAQPPRIAQWINQAGSALEQGGLLRIDLSEAGLAAAARRQAGGLSDWGDDDFWVGLRVLLQAYRTEAQLNFIGRVHVQRDIHRVLTNRLLIHDTLKRHPDIRACPVVRPLFICGLPRTGTTLLQRLLAQDPAHRHLRTWEGFRPAPLPAEQPGHAHLRIVEMDRNIKLTHWIVPEFSRTIHPIGVNYPEECIQLLQHTFLSHIMFEQNACIPSYTRWLDAQDMVPAYRYFRSLLQLLSWQKMHSSQHWLLKSPAHLFALDALLTVFPDAHIIQTHRDPADVVPSFASLYGVLWKLQSDQAHGPTLGNHVLERLSNAIEHALTVRQTANPHQFFDVRYPDLVRDPISMVQRIYAYFGYAWHTAVEQKMERWLAANAGDTYGIHRYSAADFGLDTAALSRRFQHYRSQFLG